MAGLAKEFYNILITSLVGKIKNYGSNVSFNRDLPINKTFNVTGPCPTASVLSNKTEATEKLAKYPTYYTNLKIQEVDQNNAPASDLLRLNNKCYLGLLVDAPIYYSGTPNITINNVQYANLYPAKYFNDSPTIATSFLEVHEIPNTGSGVFNNVDDDSFVLDPSKLFGGGYWSSYKRLCVTKRQPDLAISNETSTYHSDQYNIDYTYDTYKIEDAQNDPVTDGLSYYDIININKARTDYYPEVYLNNPSSLYIGENTNKIAWPAVKYFGLFNNQSYSGNVKIEADTVGQTAGKIHIYDNTLYYWGEITENNKWYHEWMQGKTHEEKQAAFNAARAGLYELINSAYVLTTDASYNQSKTYYEKTGIIVGPSQGGVFSKEKFKISWDSEIITNALG